MKKQFFLLSLLMTVCSATITVASTSNCCATTCDTACNTDCNTSCSTTCVPEHGHVYLNTTPEFQFASPERVSLFESSRLKNLKQNDKHGDFQVVIFGGKNTKGSAAAGYYLPYGHTTLTFDGSVKNQIFAQVQGESITQIATAKTGVAGDFIEYGTDGAKVPGSFVSDQSTYQFDTNKDTSKILPWNFGITYAALFEPRGASANGALVGSGLITTPDFKSTISPCLRRWHVGAGLELTYHFSDEADGWYGRISTAIQNVRSRIVLNENVTSEKDALDDNLAPANIFGTAATATPVIASTQPLVATAINNPLYPVDSTATVAPVGSLQAAYIGTGFPNDVAGNEGGIAPNNVAEAFNQAAWTYGKIGCEQKITRLADIELSVGRLWTCGDCASTSWELGLVIPAGNKPCATYVAPAVVGNGQHFGIRTGSITTVMLKESEECSTWFRLDIDGRYLFKNTQMRSFDLLGNEWSRYMMVWKNKEAYTAAVTAANAPVVASGVTGIVTTPGVAQRGYTPGINVFTTSFYVKPQFQGRVNNAVVFCGEHFRAELGWAVHAKQKECVSLACDWDSAPAFADSSYVGGVGLNNNRTIYNDSQTTVVNAISVLNRGNTGALFGLSNEALTDDAYDSFAISEAEISLDSVASVAAITNKPYITLGYAFDCDWAPVLGIGASYEFTSGNRALNQWLVWGKFEFAF
ncbi:hypothetical protein KBD08_03895 [Candidatus Babeliales bacterium]|nr:hypothetical protein [Candidatus Babeliales bacterium]